MQRLWIVALIVFVSLSLGNAYEFPFEDGEGYFEEICAFSTDYSTSSEGRKTNIRLAAKALDDFYLPSDGTLSFNATVGERSENRGYKKAAVIVYGKYAEGVGGGVCQVSTTLYNAVLKAGFSVEKSVNHTYPSSYVGIGFDAAVSSSTDLVVRNDTDYPAIIKTFADGKTLTVKIYSMRTAYTDKIKLIAVVDKVVEGEYETQYDKTGEGEETVVKYPKRGYVVSTYRIKNGVKEKLRTSYYRPQNGLKILRPNADGLPQQ